MPRLWSVAVLGLSLQTASTPPATLPPAAAPPAPTLASTSALGLTPTQAQLLQHALQQKDYSSAEAILLDALHAEPTGSQTNARLLFLGGLYFLHHDSLQAAVAWNKAAALAPLPAGIRFSLAMSYVELRHPDWAVHLLTELETAEPHNALYPFWLGRLAYDQHLYEDAITHLRQAIQLDPRFAKAHDNLGLALFYLNRNDEALAEFHHAIELDAGAAHPSPWPWLNLGIAHQFLGQAAQAIAAFRHALALSPGFAEAHYRLGSTLASLGPEQLDEAIREEQAAVRDDPAYPEPHEVLARLYRRHNQPELSQSEVDRYHSLHEPKKQGASPENR